MKKKNFWLPGIILAVTLVAVIVSACIMGVVEHPSVSEHTFRISITYELNGEILTIEDDVVCQHVSSEDSMDEQARFWTLSIPRIVNTDRTSSYLVAEIDGGELVISPDLSAGYLMGDPQFADDAEQHNDGPYVYYLDSEYNEYTDEQTLERLGFRLISYDYPQPIQNSFSFYRISDLDGSIAVGMTLVALAGLALCIIFVRRDKSVPVGPAGQLSMVLNILVGIIAVPFLTVVAGMLGIAGDDSRLSSQLIYLSPSLTVLGLAASLCLRRRGYVKSSIVAQLIGPALFAISLLLEFVGMIFFY